MKKIVGLALMTIVAAPVIHAASLNDPAPLFALKDRGGKEVALKNFKGSDVVFINFWATWCPPCNQEFPKLSELANEYKGRGLQVVTINLDENQENVKTFFDKLKIKSDAILILLDPESKVVANYKAKAMPSSFIVDKTGIIRFIHLGYNEKDPAKWRKEIEDLLSEGK